MKSKFISLKRSIKLTKLSLTDKSQKYNWRCYYQLFRERESTVDKCANKLDNLKEIKKWKNCLKYTNCLSLFKKKEKFCELVNSAEILEFMIMIEYFHP